MAWFMILSYAIVALTLPAAVLYEALRVRLQRRHPEVWVDIGQPRLLETSKLARFVYSGRDRTVGDPTVAQLGLAIRAVRWVFYLVGAAWWVTAALDRPRIGIPVTILCLAMVGLIHVLNRKPRGAA